MKITLRLENKNDYKEVENLTREVFWNLFCPGCDVHCVLHNLRKSKEFIPQLDYVAIVNDKIVGNIIYSTAQIMDEAGNSHEVLTFVPISVEKEFQKQGIGAALINHTIQIAKEMGFKAIFIYGFADYYGKFGFENAKAFGVTTPDGKNFDDFMGLELYKGALKNISGKLIISKVYEPTMDEIEEFDKQFPFKEKGNAKFEFTN